MLTPRMAALAALAEEQAPADTDLWSAIQVRLQTPGRRQSLRAFSTRRACALGALTLLLALSAAFLAMGPLRVWPQVQQWLGHVPGVGPIGHTAGQNAPERPMAVADGAGGAMVAWIQGQRLLVARLSGEGDIAWQTALPGAWVRSAQLVPDGAGGAIVVWMDCRAQDVSGEDIYAQRLSAAGRILWQEGGVPVRVAPGPQVVRGVAPDGLGGAFVFWRDMQSAPYGLYVQRIAAAGSLTLAPDGALLAMGAGSGYEVASAVSDDQGGAIVAWQGGSGDEGEPRALSMQRVDPRGLPLWGENGIVLASGEQVTSSSIAPQLASDGVGGAVAAWQDGREQLRAARIDAQGRPLWRGTMLSAGAVANGFQLLPDDGGAFLVAWSEPPWGSGSPGQWALRTQKLDLNGATAWGTSPLVLTPATENMFHAGVVADGDGGAIAIWRSGVSPSRDGSIRLQHLSRAGEPVWAEEGVAVYAQRPRYQGYPAIVGDGAGGAIAVFLLGSGASDAMPYAQRVGAGGALLWPQAAVKVYQ